MIWSTSDKSVATVDKNGVVKGIKKGTATITVTVADGKKTAKCNVTVGNFVTGIDVNFIGQLYSSIIAEIKATPSSATNKNLKISADCDYKISTANYVYTVIFAYKEGTSKITVSSEDGYCSVNYKLICSNNKITFKKL